MLPLDGLKMAEKRLLYRRRKHSMPVFVSLTGSNNYLGLGKIEDFDS